MYSQKLSAACSIPIHPLAPAVFLILWIWVVYLLKFPVSKTNQASEDWPFVSIFLDLSRVLSNTISRVLNSNSSLGSDSVTKTRFLILIVCLLKFLVSKTNQASEDRSFVSIFLDLSRVLSETLSSVRNSNSSLGSGSDTKTRASFSYSLDLSCVFTKISSLKSGSCEWRLVICVDFSGFESCTPRNVQQHVQFQFIPSFR